jgi:hypothetical protein
MKGKSQTTAASKRKTTAASKRKIPSRESRIDDEGNTLFELPDSYFDEYKPGFKPAAKEQIVTKGDRRFSPLTAEKDIPQVSLAERIRKAR